MGVKLGLSHWGGEHRLRVFENRVLRGTWGAERGTGEKYIMRGFVVCTAQQILLG
jgi:hypothetical protein